jgi:hypothetical protein
LKEGASEHEEARAAEAQAQEWFDAAVRGVYDARERREENRAILRAATKRRERLEALALPARLQPPGEEER